MKKVLAFFLLMLMLFSAVACGEQGQSSETTSASGGLEGETTGTSSNGETSAEETTGENLAAPTHLDIVLDGNGLIPIVSASRASDTELAASANFFQKLYALTGAFAEAYEDYTPENEYEILIGNTTRPESAALAATLKPYSFAIEVTATHLIIVSSDDVVLNEGVNYFFETFLKENGAEAGNGVLRLEIGTKYVSDGTDNSAFWLSLLSSDTLVATVTEQVLSMPNPNGTTWPQGGCIKDGCFYQAFIRKDKASDEADNDVHIVKYDLKTKKLLQTSPVLDLNHCNDITYNSKIGLFVVCHNNPYRTKLSFVDPETLTVVDTAIIDEKIYSIDYNAATDRYVVGLSGGQTFCILDANFNSLNYPFSPTSRTSGYTTQGVTSDDRYIYFVLYNSNVITVYDWSGKFVTLIELNVGKIEPESIAIVRNEIYILCGTSGKGVLYKISGFVPKGN